MKHRSKTTPRAMPPTAPFGPRHILVPFDFSAGAKLALEQAAAYAREFKARLTLLHVVNMPFLGSGFGPGEGSIIEGRVVTQMSKLLAARAKELNHQGLPATAVVRLGYPGPDTVALARKEHIDLIIMGTLGRTGLKHVLLGSVAEYVVRHASCPVLVVRAPASRNTSLAKARAARTHH